MTEPFDRAATKARAEAATPGPWVVRHIGNSTRVGIEYSSSPTSLTGSLHDYDAEFIAHAREDIPAMLADLEEAEHRYEKAEAQADKFNAEADAIAAEAREYEQRAEEAERRIAAVEALCDGVDTETAEPLQGWLVDAIRALLTRDAP